MQIKVDENLCLGCGICSSLCPEVFDLNDEGRAVVKEGCNGTFIKEHNVEEVVESCPEHAVTIND